MPPTSLPSMPTRSYLRCGCGARCGVTRLQVSIPEPQCALRRHWQFALPPLKRSRHWQDAAVAAAVEVAAPLAHRQALHQWTTRSRLLPACKEIDQRFDDPFTSLSVAHVLAVFADDGKTMYSGEFVHTPRSPFPAHVKTARCSRFYSFSSFRIPNNSPL